MVQSCTMKTASGSKNVMVQVKGVVMSRERLEERHALNVFYGR